MRNVKKTRKFGDKTFKLHDWYIYKPAAKVAADTLRLRGYLVRITLRPRGKPPRGYPLCDLYYVWKRSGKEVRCH